MRPILLTDMFYRLGNHYTGRLVTPKHVLFLFFFPQARQVGGRPIVHYAGLHSDLPREL